MTFRPLIEILSSKHDAKHGLKYFFKNEECIITFLVFSHELLEHKIGNQPP
jgi:hypothetical protein